MVNRRTSDLSQFELQESYFNQRQTKIHFDESMKFGVATITSLLLELQQVLTTRKTSTRLCTNLNWLRGGVRWGEVSLDSTTDSMNLSVKIRKLRFSTYTTNKSCFALLYSMFIKDLQKLRSSRPIHNSYCIFRSSTECEGTEPKASKRS